MIISENIFYILCGCIIFLSLIPMLYARIKKKGNKYDYSIVVAIIILVAINWTTPNILTISDCDEFEKEYLLFPGQGYARGTHTYIINNSEETIFLTYIPYGDASPKNNQLDHAIQPGEIYKAPVMSLDYILVDAPERVRIKGKGTVKTELSCFPYDDFEYENDIYSEDRDILEE